MWAAPATGKKLFGNTAIELDDDTDESVLQDVNIRNATGSGACIRCAPAVWPRTNPMHGV